jgi:adenylate cyclase
VLIDFCGPPGAFLRLGRQFSAGRLLDGEVPAGALAGRLALVGPMMSMQDRFAVPLARPQDPHALRESLRRQRGIEIDESVEVDIRRLETMSGLEVHANLVAQFLDRRYLRELRAEKPLLAQAAIPAVLLPLGWLTFLPGRPGARRRRLWGLAAAGLLALAVPAAIWGVSLLAFARAGWVWTPVELVAAWGALATTGLLSSARRLRIQNGRIERMFGTAVGRELLEHIHANPQILSRCRRCEATVLFADIRGFTTLSERTDPEGVVEILREHFQGLFPALAEQGAWVDKYAGDLVMAAWGVLDGEEDHALRAVRAAVKMQRARARMNEQRLRRGEDPIEIGIGIHSGPLVAGNVGSEQRSNFTVIGDGVNLASRIEHHAGPGEILISEATWRQVSDDVSAERREGVKIRGKRGEYVLYAVRGLRGADEG